MTSIFKTFTLAFLALGLVGAESDHTVLSNEVERLNNQSLLWGPYKPNLYFGVRPRLADGVWTGLLWSRVEDVSDIQNRTFASRTEEN